MKITKIVKGIRLLRKQSILQKIAVKALNGNFGQRGGIMRLFGFHYFEPHFNSFLYIGDGLSLRLSLGKASGKSNESRVRMRTGKFNR